MLDLLLVSYFLLLIVIVSLSIGIVSEKDYDNPGHTYIAASYVKYIESAGARVVPIMYLSNCTINFFIIFYRSTSTEDEIRSIFSSINGLVTHT